MYVCEYYYIIVCYAKYIEKPDPSQHIQYIDGMDGNCELIPYEKDGVLRYYIATNRNIKAGEPLIWTKEAWEIVLRLEQNKKTG